MVDHARLERRPLHRQERAVQHGTGSGPEEDDDLEVVLGMTAVVLLPERPSGIGCPGMKMPGFAPSVPAVQEPSVLITRPCPSSVAVDSPKYQTFPFRFRGSADERTVTGPAENADLTVRR